MSIDRTTVFHICIKQTNIGFWYLEDRQWWHLTGMNPEDRPRKKTMEYDLNRFIVFYMSDHSICWQRRMKWVSEATCETVYSFPILASFEFDKDLGNFRGIFVLELEIMKDREWKTLLTTTLIRVWSAACIVRWWNVDDYAFQLSTSLLNIA